MVGGTVRAGGEHSEEGEHGEDMGGRVVTGEGGGQEAATTAPPNRGPGPAVSPEERRGQGARTVLPGSLASCSSPSPVHRPPGTRGPLT